ncbi:hypothetical protein VNO78_20305 [Psophocarpus tetragonolobus]|uniref:Uncharacterized protein n=1 Tax=Psophocarpus tetragonolobus TaxID=3891 RepID=A0AAN9XGL5_PSOTE
MSIAVYVHTQQKGVTRPALSARIVGTISMKTTHLLWELVRYLLSNFLGAMGKTQGKMYKDLRRRVRTWSRAGQTDKGSAKMGAKRGAKVKKGGHNHQYLLGRKGDVGNGVKLVSRERS